MTGTPRRSHALAFGAAVSLVIAVSIAAYTRHLPAWIAPGDTDKLFHFAMGGILAFFLDHALRHRAAWRSRVAPPLSSVVVLVPLGIDEYFQRFSAVRSSSAGDFAADLAGVIVFTIAARALAARSIPVGTVLGTDRSLRSR